MKRRGFTLIELMVVIAIIIILAAIAIPNYLTMTARAKKSRVASDFASVATALETYKTDWNTYPVFGVGPVIVQGTNPATLGLLGVELSGPGTYKNKSPNVTGAGDTAPIQYMTKSILVSMVNPFSNAAGDEYQYTGTVAGATTSSHWLLTAAAAVGGKVANCYSRTDETPTLSGPGAAAAIPVD